MTTFLITLVLLSVSAACMAALAFAPATITTTRAANFLGPLGAVVSCACGLYAVMAGAWDTPHIVQLPWGLPIGECLLGFDPLTRLFLLPVFGLGMVCALCGANALRAIHPEEHNLGAHWFFFLLLILGLAIVMTARDVVLFLIAWEVMSLAPFFLIDFSDGERRVRDASWVYLVAAHLGAVLLIACFALLWKQADSTNFSVLASLPYTASSTLLFLLAVLGFGAKAGMAPLHVWLPEAYPAAPNHVSALLSGAMSNVGLYGIIRMFDFLGPAAAFPAWWGWTLLGIGFATGLMGILKAMAQTDLNRLIAYSSVENMGVMLMGVGTGLVGIHANNGWIALLGFAGTLFHMLNHAAFKGLLFLCAGEIVQAVNSSLMPHMGGLQKKLPLVGAAFALGSAAIACLPPLNGFAGELVLALSMMRGTTLEGVESQLGLLFALAGLALISGLSAATFAKAYGITFLGEPRTGFAAMATSPPWTRLWPLALPVATCVFIGVAAPMVFRFVAPAAQTVASLSTMLLPTADATIASVSTVLRNVALFGICGIAAVLALLGVRYLLLRARPVRRAETWGCGYQYATPRIQYTDAAFSEPIAKIFGSAMGLKEHKEFDSTALFPTSGHLGITAPDRLRTGLFTPLFETIARVCNALKIMQHGRIHFYILYILATLLSLLVWGLHA